MNSIARIAVSAATYHIDMRYDYLIPDELSVKAVPGMRVIVPFGRGNKTAEGIILTVTDKSKAKKLKSIISLLDEECMLDGDNIKLALWMREKFFCTVYDAVRCMVPAKTSFKQKIRGRNSEHENDAGIKISMLNEEQTKAYESILPLIKSNSPAAALLYGVTGSGKTLVYLELIEATLALGKTAIVLVPEIALTPQAVRIFESRFGSAVAVLHSRLADGERYCEWQRIRNRNVGVVIGTRSAIFAPLQNIGLIVIDEEQEHTYKSETAPRYHARDIAKYKVTRSNGLLLLASATPSIESMYAAKNGKYSLHRLSSRYNEKNLPDVILADMKNELKAGNTGQISSVLRDEIEKNIRDGEQSILFLNRRGANTTVVCMSCGYTYLCRNCSVSMTYHLTTGKLLCHYCGYNMKVPDLCPECSGKLKYIGAGTQKIEQELESIFPGISIIRMDADTTSRKNSHYELLKQFHNSKTDILLGTQMVTKGLDFENVTLVGVLNADLSLYVGDYRASERTFSLITQVVGRSGRGEKSGRAVIQTYTPKNKVILLASKQDYDTFYDSEISVRQALCSPPVRDLISLTATGTKEDKIINACNILKHMLTGYFKNECNTRLLGPAPAPVYKVKNRFYYRLLINCNNNKHTRETISHVIREFYKDGKNSGVMIYADVE